MDKALKDLYSSAEPKQKLTILRMEMVTPISTIRGYVTLMKKHYESNGTQSAEFKDWVNQIAKAADLLKELLDME